MDYSKLPKPNFTGLFLSIALGVIVAVIFYQIQVRGLIPSNISLPKGPTIQTQIVVQEENAVISAVDKASPSVVAIGITERVINSIQNTTIGTGFVVSDKGIIVTNKHVVSDSGTYTVVTKDNQKYDVKKIYRDPILDLAIVQIDAKGLKGLELGDSSKLKVGQTVIAIGNALGQFTNTVTTGVVSGLGRKVVAGDVFGSSQESLDDLIQTDAAINPGNSGGPLLNSSGQVIGVNVAVSEGAQNIGFAFPINSVKAIVEEFINKGSVSQPYLGVRYRFISKDVALLNEVSQGAYIQEVIPLGPAEKAGVKSGDIITKISGQTVDSENIISEIISKAQIGNRIDLEVLRDGKTLKLTVVLEELPSK